MGETNSKNLFSGQPDTGAPRAPTTPDRDGSLEGGTRSLSASESEVPTTTKVQASREAPGRKLYQDEVYGTKELSPLAVAVIDTPEFQRLAYIYQLGFTHTVFLGA